MDGFIPLGNDGLLDQEQQLHKSILALEGAFRFSHGPQLPVKTLSGGNAQRIAIAKWVATQPRILILDSPTVGVDIANKEGIYQIARQLAEQGMAVLMICDEIPEAYYNSHRVLVMRRGELVAEFNPHRCSEEEIAEVVNA